MTEIFFIAYQFPPLNVGGTFRPLKFVKYFNDFGIKPIIFTLLPDDYPKVYENKNPDYNLLKSIDNVDKEIIYVKSDDLLSKRKNKIIKFTQIYFNLTKGLEHKKWKTHFFKAAENALKKYNPKAIIVTAPPFGIVELAVKLSKKTNLPLIIDMRDSMSMWISQPYGSYFHYKLTLGKERKWFNHATKVVTVTQQVVNDWLSVHKNIAEDKFVVIPNGFDADLSYDEIIIPPTKDKFTIGYVGSFYYNPESRKLMFQQRSEKHLHRKLQYLPRKEDWLYRSPFFLFKAVKFLIDKFPGYKNKIQIKFAGAKPDWIDEMVNQFDLQSNVSFEGFLTYDEVVKFQKKCDALLITSVKVIDGEDYCIAGKTFDYITAGKPILGFVTQGAQKEFIEKSGFGTVCDPDDTEKSAFILKNILDKGIVLKPNKHFVEKFHRKYLTKQLVDLILNV